MGYKIGEAVVLSELGRKNYQDSPLNPHAATGTYGGSKSNWPHWVRWDADNFNEYKTGEIELKGD